jgi:hypothetical protein
MLRTKPFILPKMAEYIKEQTNKSLEKYLKTNETNKTNVKFSKYDNKNIILFTSGFLMGFSICSLFSYSRG